MEIDQLKIKNFKGIKDLEIRFSGVNTDIYGKNAAGKSSLLDSVSWLLFNKDGRNQSQFEIKPFDEDGNTIHGLESSVEASFNIDGRQTTLKKVFYEKYTKKRGTSQSEFTGHTSDYYIDGTPKKEKDFNEFIKKMADSETFRLLTDCHYFNEVMPWQNRRALLFEIAGDVTDFEIIESDLKFSVLPGLLNGKTLDDFRATLKSRKTAINKELQGIPARMDENDKKVEKNLRAKGTIENELSSSRADLKAANDELTQIVSGGETALKTKSLNEAQAAIISHDNKIAEQRQQEAKKREADKKPLVDAVTLIERKIERKQSTIPDMQQDLAVFEKNIIETDAELPKLRAEWEKINDRHFEYSQESVCPTCGQDIPQEQLDDARGKALAIFNADKASQLKHNVERGKAQAQNLANLKASIENKQNDIKAAQDDIESLKEELSQAQQKVTAFDTPAEPKPDKDREKLVAARDKIQAEIDAIKTNEAPKTDEIRERIAGIETVIEGLQAELNSHEKNKESKARIEELKAQETELSKEFEELEGHLCLTDDFVRAKSGMLTDKINACFELVNFKLFDEQVNGGIAETCVTTLAGVPYQSLSNSERIKVGLNIIRTLQQHYGLTMPVFIDNAESITELPVMDCQVISLFVSPDDEELRIERDCEELYSAA